MIHLIFQHFSLIHVIFYFVVGFVIEVSLVVYSFKFGVWDYNPFALLIALLIWPLVLVLLGLDYLICLIRKAWNKLFHKENKREYVGWITTMDSNSMYPSIIRMKGHGK